MLVGVEELVTECHHVVLGHGGAEQADNPFVQVVAQIDADQFGTDARRQAADGRGATPNWPAAQR